MRAVFTPQFFAPQPSDTPIMSAPGGVAPATIRYDEQRYGSVEAFMLHADFVSFQQRYSRLIDDMIAFARDHADQLAPPITALRLQAIATDLATFKSHLFDAEQNFFSDHKALMYGVGFDTVMQLSRSLQDKRIALQRRMDTLINVAPDTTVCAGGCITGLQKAVGVLNTSAHGITASAHRLKRQILEYAALAHTRQHHRYHPGNEVHYANAYFNYGADALGVALRPDPFTRAAESTITQALFNEFDQTVRQTLLPVTMTCAMADDYASQIETVAETDNAGNIAAANIDSTIQRITALQEATLDAEFGPIPLHDFLMEIPADGGYRITKRPTLIAVRLMDRLKKERMVAYEPVTLAKAVDGDADLLYLDGLLWIKRKGQHEPLDKDQLCRTSPLTLLDTLLCADSVDNERCLQIFCEIAEAVVTLPYADQTVAPRHLPDGWLKDFVAVLPDLSGSRKDALKKQLLDLALRFDDGAAMHALLEKGADKNTKSQIGFSLAGLAAASGCTSVLHVLVKSGADIEACVDGAVTALMLAAMANRSTSLTILLEAGARVDAVSAGGGTALMIAASNGHVEIVRSLLRSDANPDMTSHIGETALMMAAKNGHVDVLRTLISAGAKINTTGGENFTALMVAAECGQTHAVAVLLEADADSAFCAESNQHTALTLAAQNGHTDVVEALLAAGAPVSAQLKSGHTALMLAASVDNTEMIRVLLDKKAEIEHKTVDDGYSALMLATVNGHAATVAMLAAAGADMESRSRMGDTPLVEAARQGNHAVLTALLASGAPTETRTSNNGQTALMQAALLYDETESLRLLLDAGALIDAQTESGQTALALAAHHENNEAVELLVQRGASTECRTPEGLTPLMIMAQLGYIHAMEGLLSKNASRDALAPDGRSAGDMVHDAYVQRANRRAQADEVHPNPCG